MRYILLLLLSTIALADELPDAPHLKMRPPIETYSPDERMIVHNAPSTLKPERYRLFDWQFLTIHSIYAGALAFDLTVTSRGVANGCEEASSNLGPFPTNRKIMTVGLIEFGGVVAIDAGMKALGRHLGSNKWGNNLMGSVGATIGTFKHTHGGYEWTQTGCL